MRTLELAAELYSCDLIEQAIGAYEHLAKIVLSSDGEKHSCVFSDCRYDELQTVGEFENYLIDLSNSGAR